MYRPVVWIVFLSMLGSAGCVAIDGPQAAPTTMLTATPEKVELVDGEFDPCLRGDLAEN